MVMRSTLVFNGASRGLLKHCRFEGMCWAWEHLNLSVLKCMQPPSLPTPYCAPHVANMLACVASRA
eukprot:scaffold258682_cov36-Tisochrysis_lutea.AAC.1